MAEDSMTTMARQEIEDILRAYNLSGVVMLLAPTGGSSFWQFNDFMQGLIQSDSPRDRQAVAYYGAAYAIFFDEVLKQLDLTKEDVVEAIESKALEMIPGEVE